VYLWVQQLVPRAKTRRLTKIREVFKSPPHSPYTPGRTRRLPCVKKLACESFVLSGSENPFRAR